VNVRRRLLNLLTALSLLLAAAVVVLWVRSYERADWVQWQRSRLTGPRQHLVVMELFAAHGMLVFTRDTQRANLPAQVGDEEAELIAGSGRPDGVRLDRFTPHALLDGLTDSDFWPRYGFLAETRGFDAGADGGSWYTVVTLPLWALVVLAALPPAVRLPPYARRRSRTRRGLCPRCAYDLTGNLSGVCPECGRTLQLRKR
jgi:hypothetical protein